MTNKTDMQIDPPYLDDEERQMMESLYAAMDRGEIHPKTAEEVAKDEAKTAEETLNKNRLGRVGAAPAYV